jgi:predicted XRE-type DNA-binding protein
MVTRHRKRPAGKRKKVRDSEFTVGSGNVFKDLGMPNAEERFAKVKLAMQINEIITRNGWTQKTAAEKLGTKQPEISSLKRGRLRSITYDRLLGWLKLLGYSVTIEVERSTDPHLEVAIAL